MDKIIPCLWFEGRVEEALELWGSLLSLEVVDTTFHDDAGPGTPKTILTARFRLEGREYIALNAGPAFPPSEFFSFSVDCEDQAEVDRLWEGLLADGGEESQCGWLKDRFGFSWQIVPRALPRLLADPDREKAARVMAAMMKMVKLDVATLEAAAAG